MVLITSRVIWYTWKVIWSILKIWPPLDPCVTPTEKWPNRPKFCQNIFWPTTTLKPSITNFRQKMALEYFFHYSLQFNTRVFAVLNFEILAIIRTSTVIFLLNLCNFFFKIWIFYCHGWIQLKTWILVEVFPKIPLGRRYAQKSQTGAKVGLGLSGIYFCQRVTCNILRIQVQSSTIKKINSSKYTVKYIFF